MITALGATTTSYYDIICGLPLCLGFLRLPRQGWGLLSHDVKKRILYRDCGHVGSRALIFLIKREMNFHSIRSTIEVKIESGDEET